jgi:hypothetical protein
VRALKYRILTGALLLGASVPLLAATQTQAANPSIKFTMVRSTAVSNANCLTGATATVRVVSRELTEKMTVTASGLPPNTNYDLFVTQIPNAPFGVSWYQSDLHADKYGRASVTVVGRFSVETFAVAPGSAVAPTPHSGIDAATNPAFAPIHTFHLGFWFNSPADAAAAGCPTTVTPFNGDHTAGIQAMSTRNFADTDGPLGRLAS